MDSFYIDILLKRFIKKLLDYLIKDTNIIKFLLFIIIANIAGLFLLLLFAISVLFGFYKFIKLKIFF